MKFYTQKIQKRYLKAGNFCWNQSFGQKMFFLNLKLWPRRHEFGLKSFLKYDVINFRCFQKKLQKLLVNSDDRTKTMFRQWRFKLLKSKLLNTKGQKGLKIIPSMMIHDVHTENSCNIIVWRSPGGGGPKHVGLVY